MRIFFALLLIPALALPLSGQERKDKAPVTFEELYDEPYSINKLFVHFQPIYGELFVTNINAGFGVEAQYYLQDKADFKAHFRKTYSQRFYDFSRDLAVKNSLSDNRFEVFNYFELGGTYHVKDFEESSKTKVILYRKSYTANRWASRVPLHAEIPCKVRKIYGARAGGIFWDSTTDLNRALAAQGLTNANLTDAGGNGLPLTYFDELGREQDLTVHSNIYSRGFYLGGSYASIRNIAVSIDKYDDAMDDSMFTAFMDIMIAPGLSLDNVFYQGAEYSSDAVKLKMFGVRAGIEGKFNRTLGWAYGAEMGYRPSIEGRTFYAMFKISFPVFATSIDYKVESFGK